MSALTDMAEAIREEGCRLERGRVVATLSVTNTSLLTDLLATHAGEFEAWLARRMVGRDASCCLWADYRRWSATFERSAQQRQLMLSRIKEYPFLARLWIGTGYHALTALRLLIKQSLERLAVRVLQRRQDNPLHDIGQREVLCQHHLQGIVERHLNLSVVVQSGDDAESGAAAMAAPDEACGGEA